MTGKAAPSPDSPGAVSEEARQAAARARAAAAGLPDAAELAGMAADALTRQRDDMSTEDARVLAVTALTHAQQVAFLLGRLAGLLDDDGPAGRAQNPEGAEGGEGGGRGKP